MQEDLVKHCQSILHPVVIGRIYARQKVGVVAICATVFVDILYIAWSYRPCGSTVQNAYQLRVKALRLSDPQPHDRYHGIEQQNFDD
jgi:hypothetical protein